MLRRHRVAVLRRENDGSHSEATLDSIKLGHYRQCAGDRGEVKLAFVPENGVIF